MRNFSGVSRLQYAGSLYYTQQQIKDGTANTYVENNVFVGFTGLTNFIGVRSASLPDSIRDMADDYRLLEYQELND